MPTLVRQLKNLRYRVFYSALLRRGHRLMALGDPSTGCQWTFCPDGLNERSIIYTGGVGKDVTFEHALVKQFGCTIVLCDPSPTGLQTMRKPENQIPQFKFHPVALAAHSGKLALAPPRYEDEGSWFMRTDGTATLEVPCTDLATLFQKNNHSRIDLLKIDIEGAEYGLLDDLLKRHLPVRQLLVEFHHGNLPGIQRGRTVRTILRMVAGGFRLLHQEGGNHTFMRFAG